MANAAHSTTLPENPAPTRRGLLLQGAVASGAMVAALPISVAAGPAIDSGEAAAPTRETLEAYSTWLFYERRRLMVELHGVEGAARFGGFVRCDNPAFYFHFPSFDTPSPAPSARAVAVMALAGVPDAIPIHGPRRKPAEPKTAPVTDPLLALIRDHDRQLAIFERDCPDDDAAMGALRERTYQPAIARLENDPPAPTTFAGALAGLAFVQRDLDQFSDFPPLAKLMRVCLDVLRDMEAMA